MTEARDSGRVQFSALFGLRGSLGQAPIRTGAKTSDDR